MRDDIMIYDPRGIDNRRPRPAYGRPETVEIDIGLRQYMLRVYNFMAAGLGISGLVAYLAVTSGFYQQIAGIPLIWIVMLAPLGAVLFRSFRIERISAGAALVTFRGFAVLMGLSLASDFPGFHGRQASRGCSSSAPGAFAAMSLYGYATGRDLVLASARASRLVPARPLFPRAGGAHRRGDRS